ncbi:MAG: bifunctional transcriptional activator/DNA repair enzyme protein Ada [Sphingomonadales bacterium 32-68-7]|nr:MAG: bifunctional transcriptional activator/DNA repair enzyme protein Ada [Sphingomonadales bacterium 12-68-11]OYX09014.1 MAG: bifunctional transcriptional activator/DNA repair enzyme protein Ada [Sphingomonadales bacterium 32-68-7]
MDSTELMQAAFAARDRSYDGRFVVAVTTTNIYCRPSCPARRPRPENTRFYASAEQAREAGFRPCRRCEPDGVTRDRAAVELAIDLLRQADARIGPRISLAELAAETGYSPSHMQRVFTRATGLSPAAYARALREERARVALSTAGAVTGAIYEAGFESASRFYDSMEGKLGMTPSAWVRGGAGATIRWAVVATTLGPMLVAATDRGVCRLSFDETAEDLAVRFPNADLVEGGEAFAELLARVIEAVERPGAGHDIPLDVQGTAFQQRVWAELRRIPAGETRSYAQIAAAAGHPGAVRAAGSANGANAVAVLIPCHRVIRADGSLGGYAYGLDIKRELLERERQ